MGPKKLTWVTEQATDSSSRFIAGRGVGRTKDEHKKVRKHAAQSSAATRLATMRRKQHDEIMEVVRKHYTALESGSLGLRKSEDVPPPWFINRLLAESSWYQTAVQMNSLGQKSTRNILWGAITHNTALLQVGFLVAGTHTNSCGIPPGKLVHMGPALVHLRTASLQSVQSAIESSVRDSLTAVAVALLAGWERSSRHGDESAYEMHMSAWRQMKHPPTTEEERNVDTLCDAVWKLFKENLDELSAITSASPSSSRPQYPATLPPGFRIFSLARPETRSLLDVASRVSAVEPTILGSLSQIRELCLQGISWSVSHSVSVGLEACPAHEEGWDHLEIQALYHIRAALISLNGVLHMVASKTHRVHWIMDHRGALLAHTMSCRHLATETLMGTKYAAVALWSRYMMCAVGRDPETDRLLHKWMRLCGVDRWTDLEALLQSHIDLKQYLGNRLHDLYMIATGKADDLKLNGWDNDGF